MLPLRIFSTQKPDPDEAYLYERAKNALKKAMKVKPVVQRLLWLERDSVAKRYYLVYQNVAGAREHMVTLFYDRDGTWFGACNCPAGNPPADENTGIQKWQLSPCYCLAAVLLSYVKTERRALSENQPHSADPAQ